MSYTIYKTNGIQLLTLLDGTLNNQYGVNLVGKNYINYGTVQNENFVYLLENFASGTAPAYPLAGQLWYNTASNTISFYDGTTFNGLANVSQLGGGIGTLNTALLANVASLQSAIQSNAAIQTANAAVQANQITSLWANAAVQDTQINDINSNVAGANVSIGLLQATATGLAYKTDSTNNNVSAVVGNVTILQGNVVALFANAGVQATAIASLQGAGYATTSSLSAYAPLNSPVLTGNPQSVTVSPGDISNSIATTSFVDTVSTSIKSYSDTNLSTAITNLTNTITGQINLLAPLASAALTGTPTAPTQSFSDNSGKIATTAWVRNATQYWDGSRKYVSAVAPTSGDGADGDIWFQYQ